MGSYLVGKLVLARRPLPELDLDGDGLTNLQKSIGMTALFDADTDGIGLPAGYGDDTRSGPTVADIQGEAVDCLVTNVKE